MSLGTSGILHSQAIKGFIKIKVVEGLSESTLVSYQDHLLRFLEYLDDIPLTDVHYTQLEDFFLWLRSEYIPQRITGSKKPLSHKTVYNIWVTLKSFFSWADGHEFLDKNPMEKVPRGQDLQFNL